MGSTFWILEDILEIMMQVLAARDEGG